MESSRGIEEEIRQLLDKLVSPEPQQRQEAADRLREQAHDIPYESLESTISALQQTDPVDTPQVRGKKEAALIQVCFVALDRFGAVDAQTSALQKLLERATRDVVRDLIDRWVDWVASDERPMTVETVAEQLRTNPYAVLPLVDHFARKLELSVPLRRLIIRQTIEPEYFALIREFHPELDLAEGDGEIDRPAVPSLANQLLDSLSNRSPKFAELNRSPDKGNWKPRTLVAKCIALLFEEERANRELNVYRRIASQLAHMSDMRFYDLDKDDYESVRSELDKHARPVVVFNLPKRPDLDVRKSLALMLGYIGGREAIDPLVQMLIDEERTRDNRQRLLSEYYLDPSRKRGEEAAQILRGADEEARRTLRILQVLNIIVFAVGVLTVGAGVALSFTGTEGIRTVAGALTTLGGLTGILVQLIRDPLDRIQNAMANLVQIETAFTSFIWELNLNGTYIQSRYVANGQLTDDEISQTVRRMEDAMGLAMNQVAVYTEVGQQRILTRIHNLEPAAGAPGTVVKIHGQHLLGDQTDKKANGGIVSINHNPVVIDTLEWREDRVSCRMPSAIPGLGDGGTVWISLLVDGMETNALPFHVITQPATA